jgi:osmotically-inducible protein OsmY
VIFGVALLCATVACSNTARGVVQDTKDNTATVKAGVETLDVKTAILADKTIDAGAIDVDTNADTKTVVIRGSVPTEAQKARAEQIAREHAPNYKIENRLAVVPQQ